MIKRIALLTLIAAILWCPMVQAKVVMVTGDKFLNEGYIASGTSTMELPQYLEFGLINFHTKRNETYYELWFKTEYWSLKSPSFNNEKYFTGIDIQFNNKMAFSLPPSQQQIFNEIRLKTGEYTGDCVSRITSDNKRMDELVRYIKEATTVKVRVSYNDGTQAIFDLPADILTEWQIQVIPYTGPLSS